ncbi:MAG TPA: hypothetical protein VF442_12260 [Sphingobium sp.]
MSRLHSLAAGWNRLRAAARREFLRDPEVILFEHVPQAAEPGRKSAGAR